MRDIFNCVICGGNNWVPIESYRFSRDRSGIWKRVLRKAFRISETIVRDGPSDRLIPAEVNAPPRAAEKADVFFDLWFNGEGTVSVSSVYCANCGFTCYSPRPDSNDLDEKYRHLAKTSHQKQQTRVNEKRIDADNARGLRLLGMLRPMLPHSPSKILDFGGGRGQLARPFALAGHHCYLIDHNEHPVSEVNRLGSSLLDIDPLTEFDLIICSHVLEHLAYPAQVLAELAGKIRDGGCMYIEVPSEIHGCVRIEEDPVTHVNFFTPASLRSAVHRAGLRVVESGQGRVKYENNEIDALWVIAEKSSGAIEQPIAAPDILEYLHPGRRFLLRRLLSGFMRRLHRIFANRLERSSQGR